MDEIFMYEWTVWRSCDRTTVGRQISDGYIFY